MPAIPKTRKIAVASVMTALSAVILYLASAVPTMRIALTAIAGILPAAVVIEGGLRWGALCYASAALLSLAILPDKGVAVLYIVVFGHYPMAKYAIERLRSPVLQWVCKLALLNACIGLMLLLFVGLFFESVPNVSLPVIFTAANAAFVVFDLGLTKLIAYYTRHIRTKYR